MKDWSGQLCGGGTGERASITKKPRMLTVCCTLVCIILMQKGQFNCELSGTGEGVSITKKPRMLTVCCTLVCII